MPAEAGRIVSRCRFGRGVPRAPGPAPRTQARSGRGDRLAGSRSCRLPLRIEIAVIRLEGGPHRGGSAIQARLGGTGRYLKDRGHLRQREADVVVQDEDRSLIEVKTCKTPVELVALGN